MRSSILQLKTPRVAAVCAAFLFAGAAAIVSPAIAQKPVARIGSVVDGNRAAIASSHPTASDAGAVPDTMQLEGMTLVFSRSAAQQAALDALIVAQQDPSSPQYHQWLTPDQFATQFGLADSDLSAVTAWLGRQGFTGATTARSRDRISFSGSAAQFAAAFGSPIHYFTARGEKHFAPSGSLSVPAAITPAVLGLEHVTDYRPKPQMKKVNPAFTSSLSGSHFMTPKDVATIYDVNAAYSAGYTGAGQQIAVIGQSAVVASDITNFQTAAGVPVRAPQMILVPGTGSSQVYEGDESESDLDLEYSSAMGQGASVFFVYSGSSPTADVSTAIEYAISNRIASIITISYSYCEAESGFGSNGTLASEFVAFNSSLQQAAAQGQTVVAASGDQGALSCYDQDISTPSVGFPASSQYVTAVGGTEFPTTAVAIGNTQYWQQPATVGTTATDDIIGSAISYIPEVAWNDNSVAGGLSGGGGGVSLYFPRPTWQTGVTGIPSGTARLVPDLALDSSEANAPYLYCSSDPSSAPSGGSCVSGFRNGASSGYLTAAGGTSFAAPIFAGLLSVLEQKLNANGLGLIGPALYSLAANPTTYASAFHDVNVAAGSAMASTACTSGVAYPIEFNSNGTVEAYGPACTTVDAASFPTGAGYDEATGLGSIDFNSLINAWPAVTTLAGSRVTIAAASTSVAANANDLLAIAVGPTTGSGTATGTVAITVDGVAATTLTLSNGAASYSFTAGVSGNHSVVAAYSGNGTYAPSSTTAQLTVTAIGGFTLAVPNVTVSNSTNANNVNITVTPTGGYRGSIDFTVSSTTLAQNTCYAIVPTVVTGTGAVTGSLQIYDNASICSGYTPLYKGTGKVATLNRNTTPGNTAPIGISLAGLLAIGLLGRRSKRLRGLVIVAVLMVAGFGLSGCGESNTVASGSSGGATGTFTITVTGTDTVTPSVSSSTTFTLTLQ